MKNSSGFYPRAKVDTSGSGAVGQAGGVLLTDTVSATGLGRELSGALAPWRRPGAVHDPAKVVLDLAVTLALGGDCLADVALLRAEPGVYGAVASDPTVSCTITALAADASAALGRSTPPGRRPDAGRGRWPARTPGPRLRPAGHRRRPGNAGSNAAADHVTVVRDALRQLPGHRPGTRPGRKVLIRTDGAGATHAFVEWLTGQRLSYSLGFTLPDTTPDLLRRIPEHVWTEAYDAHDAIRDGAWVAELTDLLDLSSWPAGMRVIVPGRSAHGARWGVGAVPVPAPAREVFDELAPPYLPVRVPQVRSAGYAG